MYKSPFESVPQRDRPEVVGYIWLTRVADRVISNMPRLLVHHSPDGFEWGYEGSGPADLAFNIVEYCLKTGRYQGPRGEATWDDYVPFELSWALHQKFKRAFVAVLPRSADVVHIPWAGVDAWIEREAWRSVVHQEVRDDA